MKNQTTNFMNRFTNYFFMLLAFVAVGFLASCGEDDGPVISGPSISYTGADIENGTFEGTVGETLSLTVTVNSEVGFNRLQITKEVDDEPIVTVLDTARQAGNPVTSFETDVNYVLQSNEVGKDVVLTFKATDDDGNTNSETLTIVTTGEPAVRFSAIILAAPLGSTSGERTSKTFFSSATGMTYSADGVVDSDENLSQMIDFGYYYLPTAETGNLASPSSFPESIYNLGPNGMQWGTLNNTLLRVTDITASQYAEYSEDNVDAIFEAFDNAAEGSNPERALDIERFDVVAFETDAGQGENPRRGLILIEDMVDGAGQDGYIEIEVLVTQ